MKGRKKGKGKEERGKEGKIRIKMEACTTRYVQLCKYIQTVNASYLV